MPRAATSVATSTGTLPAVKSASARLARALAEVAVDRPRLHAFALELRDEAVGAALGAHEHECAADAARDRGRDLHLVHLVHEEEAVLHLLDGRLVLLDLVVHGSSM